MHPNFEVAESWLSLAGRNRLNFNTRVEKYLKRHPLELQIQQDRYRTQIAVHNPHKVPTIFNVLFAQWANAVRAALDNAFYSVSVSESGQNPPPNAGRLSFPLTSNRAEFLANKQIKRLSGDVTSIIEQMQPYNMIGEKNGSVLWWLHQVARVSRHREPFQLDVRVIEFFADFPRQDFPEDGSCDPHGLCFVHPGEQRVLGGAKHNVLGTKPKLNGRPWIKSELNVEALFIGAPESFRWRLELLMAGAEGEVSFFIKRIRELRG